MTSLAARPSVRFDPTRDKTYFHSPEWWIARDRHLHADPLNHALSRRRADSNRCSNPYARKPYFPANRGIL